MLEHQGTTTDTTSKRTLYASVHLSNGWTRVCISLLAGLVRLPLLLSRKLLIKIEQYNDGMAPTKHLGMAKNKVLQAKPVVAKPHKLVSAHMDLQEPLECPLCIEHLDDTDRDFFPCPCGYQVCLFCYQRLQNEYNNTCPGCRQQYSDDLDAVRQHIERKQKQQAAEAPATSGVSHAAGMHGHMSHAHTLHGVHGHGHANHADHHTAHGVGQAAHSSHMSYSDASHKVKQLVPSPPVVPKQRQQYELTTTRHARSGEAQGTGLPSSANWVSAAAAAATAGSHHITEEQENDAPLTTADEESWPTLEVAASCSHHPQPRHDALERRQSSSSSLSSVPSQQQQQQQQHCSATISRQDPSRSSCDSTLSNDIDHPEHQTSPSANQQQQSEHELESRSSSGFMAVEVTTVVGGARHSVCVPVSSHTEVSAFPEAATLLDILQQAVVGSKLSSTEAAVQLVQCLRKLEAGLNQKQQRAWLDKALAHSRSAAARNGRGLHGSGQAANTAAGLAGNGRPPAAPCTARAPPPGFGNHPRAASGVYAPHLQQQGGVSSAGAPAANRGMPYRPVAGVQSQAFASQSDNYTSQSSMRSVDSEGSLFSQGSGLSQSAGLWTDSCLPGLDFGAGAGGLSSGVAGTTPAAVPARLQMLWAADRNQSDRALNPGSGVFTPSIPPGFGASSSVGSSRLGASNSSRLLNGSYNPLSVSPLGQTGSGKQLNTADATAQHVSYTAWD